MRMNTIKTITILAVIAIMSFLSTVASAGDALYYATEDKSVAFRIKNGYDTEVVTFAVTAGDSAANYCLIQTPGGTLVSNVLDWSGAGADEISEIATNITATCTNAEGEALLQVDVQMSLAADSTDDELLDGTSVVIQPGQWGDGGLWDTSISPYIYNVYIPGSTVGGGQEAKFIKHIGGEIGGTGNVTVEIYIDRDLVWEKEFTSPMYVVNATSANSTTSEAYGADDTLCLDISPQIPITRSQNCFIRAKRATTGTTGTMKATVEHIF